MLKNNLKLACRNLFRQKFYTLINIGGLTISLASFIFILLYVTGEVSYDKFHSKAADTYRIRHNYFMADQDYDWPETSIRLADVMRNEFPEVRYVTSLAAPVNYAFRHKDKLIGDIKTLQADSNFFKVFDFELTEGDLSTALKEPNALVISEKVAGHFFPEQPPGVYEVALGKTVIINQESYVITGVFREVPAKSHLQFDAIVSIHPLINDEYRSTTWLPAGIHHYAVLVEGVDPKSLEDKFTRVEQKHLWPEMQQHLGVGISKLEADTGKYGYYLEPILDIHLVRDGNLKYVYVFSAIGLLIIILGAINFINLYTARLSVRAKGVGIRKVLGSGKFALIVQFMTEAFLVCLAATIIAIGAVQMLQHSFNALTGKNIHLNLVDHPGFLLLIVIILVLLTVVAGGYPAWYLASLMPVRVLKSNLINAEKGNSILRRSFIVFQFTVSIVLVIGSLGLYQQLKYMQGKDPGFVKDQVIVLSNAYSLGKNKEAFKQGILAHPAIESASFSSAVPSSIYDWLGLYKKYGADQEHQFYVMEADFDFLETLGLDLKEGRSFSRNFLADSTAIIFNETAARQIGAKELIGTKITNHFGTNYTTIGIVKDFNFEHLKNKVKPLAITLSGKDGFSLYAAIKVKAGDTQETLQFLEKEWQSFNPDAPFAYSFLDEKFHAQFNTEIRTGNVMAVFTGLAILIACLGLFGLVTFTAEQRRKEIGIRKVMGASVSGIILTISNEFLKLVILSLCVAIPLAWYMLHRWLQDFAHRVEIGAGIFLFAGVSICVLAWLTIGYQSVKTALANPVDSLRNE